MEQTVWTIAGSVTEMIQTVDNNVSVETTYELTTDLTIPPKLFFLSELYSTVMLAVSIIGVLTNSVVLAVLVLAHREYGSNVNTLIANQCAIDLFCCASVVFTRMMILGHDIAYRDNQLVDNIICITVGSGLLASVGAVADKLGLVVITLERYVKIVHFIAHRKYCRSWMTKVAVALPWIGGTCLILFPAIATTRVVDGQCLRFHVWPHTGMMKVKKLWQFMSFSNLSFAYVEPVSNVMGGATVLGYTVLVFNQATQPYSACPSLCR